MCLCNHSNSHALEQHLHMYSISECVFVCMCVLYELLFLQSILFSEIQNVVLFYSVLIQRLSTLLRARSFIMLKINNIKPLFLQNKVTLIIWKLSTWGKFFNHDSYKINRGNLPLQRDINTSQTANFVIWTFFYKHNT